MTTQFAAYQKTTLLQLARVALWPLACFKLHRLRVPLGRQNVRRGKRALRRTGSRSSLESGATFTRLAHLRRCKEPKHRGDTIPIAVCTALRSAGSQAHEVAFLNHMRPANTARHKGRKCRSLDCSRPSPCYRSMAGRQLKERVAQLKRALMRIAQWGAMSTALPSHPLLVSITR